MQARQDYTLLLRWDIGRSGKMPKTRAAAAVAEECYYELGLFRHWESVEKSRGIITSRQIEKGLRWNGRNYNYRGFEFGAIRRYVSRLRRPSAALPKG